MGVTSFSENLLDGESTSSDSRTKYTIKGNRAVRHDEERVHFVSSGKGG